MPNENMGKIDTYRTFAELEQSEVRGQDYEIIIEQRDSPIAIMAPHGGDIELDTTEIAKLLAGTRFSFYTFIGLKNKGNQKLHMSSNTFDEPQSDHLAKSSQLVITIHGMRGDIESVVIGGLNSQLNSLIEQNLRANGFVVESIDKYPYLRGKMPNNICNRGRLGGGSQIEISRQLRLKILEDTERRDAFCSAIVQSLESCGLLVKNTDF